MAWTTTELLAEVRRVGQFPTSSVSSLADADLLAQADRAMQASLLPLIMRCQEEFYVRRVTQTLTTGLASYAVPRRAIASRVRDVHYVRSSIKSPLPRLRPEQIPDFNPQQTGQPFGFYLDAANIVLMPAPSRADSLSIAVFVRPGRLTAVSTGSRQLTVVSADTPTAGRTRLTFASFTTFATGSIDVISGSPPFEHKGLDLAAANITTTTLDVATADLFSTPVVGDWVTVADTSPVMQVPVEAQPLLVQRTAQFVMEGLGYLEEASLMAKRADTMAEDVVFMLTPRTDGSPMKVTGGLLKLINNRRGW